MKKIFYLLITFAFFSSCKKDVKKSTIIKICDQTWMDKNLNVSNYRNGDTIPQVKDQKTWQSLTTGAWCWYANDSVKFDNLYGKLYNWYAVNDPRGLAPQGWHIPSDTEWTILETCLGGDKIAGGKLKETGTAHWLSPNGNATNETGFTALPGEWRPTWSNDWPLVDRIPGGRCYYWTSTENPPTYAFYRLLNNATGFIYKEITGSLKTEGYSVRCIKD